MLSAAIVCVGSMMAGAAYQKMSSSNRVEEIIRAQVSQRQRLREEQFNTQARSFDRALDIVRNEQARDAIAFREAVATGNRDVLVINEANQLEALNELPARLREANYLGNRANDFVNQPPPLSSLENCIRIPEFARLLLEYDPKIPFRLRGLNRSIAATQLVRENLSIIAVKYALKCELMSRTSCKIHNLLCAIIADLLDFVIPSGVAIYNTVSETISVTEYDYNKFKSIAQKLYEAAKLDPKNISYDQHGIPKYNGPSLMEFLMRELEKAKILHRIHRTGDIDYLGKWMNGKIQYIKRNAGYITAIITAIYCAFMIGAWMQSGVPPSQAAIAQLLKQTFSAVAASVFPLYGIVANIVWTILDGTCMQRTWSAVSSLNATLRSFPPCYSFNAKERLWMYVGHPIKISLLYGIEGGKALCAIVIELLQFLWETVQNVPNFVSLELDRFVRSFMSLFYTQPSLLHIHMD